LTHLDTGGLDLYQNGMSPSKLRVAPMTHSPAAKLSARAAALLLLVGALWRSSAAPSEAAVLRFQADPKRPAITFLSWDTEGGPRSATNLLRSPIEPRLQVGAQWFEGESVRLAEAKADPGMTYRLSLPETECLWEVRHEDGKLRLAIAVAKGRIAGAELLFPFDPRVAATTVLPNEWSDDGTFRLPSVLNAPDFGPMLLREGSGRRLSGRLEGSREKRFVNLVLALPALAAPERVEVELAALLLPPPQGLRAVDLWKMARRGWLNALQPCARWGDQAKPFSAPPGVLGNNVISDPASVSLWFYADQALWMPDIAPGVSVAPLVRRTIEYWLDRRMRRDARGQLTGEITGYWDYGNFLDANAGPLIAAWDYVQMTNDRAWLARRIEQLEEVANFLARRDVDDDGLVEATQSGNRGTLVQPARSCAWWDALNCGHKDGYCNALIYRAWRCLADLEGRMGRTERRQQYARLAERLKAAYARTLLNPQTGWLAWWKSQDGELHDYASPTLNGLAIEYGLVEPAPGREILARLRAKMAAVGFTRFDLGVPPVLLPVRRSDYLLPDSAGCPKREDGTDTFGHYMNGGITAGHVLHFLAAHYVVGEPEAADVILRAMLERQAFGGFQNGVQDAGGRGIDWTTWTGRPSGYEGYLADSFRFLQALLLREPEARARFYRPLRAE
jgi:hypothetical protein